MLIEKIGLPAMLEQTAEEATELAFACLKYARFLRGENPVYGRTEAMMKSDIIEEDVDVEICLHELRPIIDPTDGGEAFMHVYNAKEERLRKRIERMEK